MKRPLGEYWACQNNTRFGHQALEGEEEGVRIHKLIVGGQVNEMSPDQHASEMPVSPMLLWPEGAALEEMRPEPGCFIYTKLIIVRCLQMSHLPPDMTILMTVTLEQPLDTVPRILWLPSFPDHFDNWIHWFLYMDFQNNLTLREVLSGLTVWKFLSGV